MNRGPLVVIGIGADGLAGLSTEARAHIAGAAVLAGGKRQLALFPDFAGEKIVIDADLPAVVARLCEAVARHKTVVLASGDPLFHGIGRVLLESFPQEDLLFLPHVSSVQLAFARIKETWNDAVVVSLHGRPLHTLRPALRRREPKIAVLTDAKNDPAAIANLLRETGVAGEYVMWVCENLGAADELVHCWQPEELPGETFAPLNVVVLLRIERTPTGSEALPLLGIPEHALHHRTRRGDLITKREIRLLALCSLELRPDDLLWDVGAGSGSVSLEAARLSPRLRVYAIEKDPEALRNIETNMRAFALPGVQVVAGAAPEVCAGLPDPDAVFIGGSGGRLGELLAVCVERLRPGGRLVMNCITLDTLAHAWEWFQARDLVPEVMSAQLAHSRPLGGLHTLEPENPIFVLRWRKGIPDKSECSVAGSSKNNEETVSSSAGGLILMLEDNAERVQRFQAALERIDPCLELRVWRNAWAMIREVEPFLPSARLISLDHDLDPEEGNAEDPGTGWDLAKFLAARAPCCPVIIHTSNGERATWMCGEFELGGWKHHRVSPLGDDWIEHDWRRLVRRLLKRR